MSQNDSAGLKDKYLQNRFRAVDFLCR